MNKAYRLVWNSSTNTWCAASEIARGRSKSSSSAKVVAATTLLAVSIGSAFAAPANEEVDLSADDRSSTARSESSKAQPDATDLQASQRSITPSTRAVATDNSAYVKIDANGDGKDNASALGDKSIAIGSNATTKASSTGLGGAVALGASASASSNNVAVGKNASALGSEGAIALGAGAAAGGKSSIALGNDANASGWGAYALGRKAQATAESGLALGDSTVASQQGAMALGLQASATAVNAMALGGSAIARGADSVALGSYSEATRDQTVSVGSAGFERQIVNVERGTENTDAANVGQLRDVASALGGNAGIAADGSVTKPAYKIGDKTYSDVGSALAATAQSAVQYDDGTKKAVTLGGTGASAVKLSNVKAGTLSATSTDAVNGAQLNATNDRVGDIEQSLTDGGLIDPGTGESLVVTYGSAKKDKVTLAGGTAGTTITNVKAGTLSAKSTDAVNGSQLFATNEGLGNLKDSLKDGGVIDPTTGGSLAVVYDAAAKDKVTLAGGAGGTTIAGVKAGKVATSSMDAVNGAQLQGVSSSVASALGGGALVATDGSVTKPAYKIGDQTYNNVGDAIQAAASSGGGSGTDANAVKYDGTSKASVTLGGVGASSSVSLKNVATGVADTDAVNVQQLATGLKGVKDDISNGLSNGSLDMKYIKVKATGVQANALGTNSVAIGSNANATNVNTLAIGSGARASGRNSIALGINSVASEANTFSVGDLGATRRIVNISDGVDESDAVNMKQLTDALDSVGKQTVSYANRMTRDVSSKPGSFVAIEGMGADGSLPNVASINGADPEFGTAAAIGVSSAAAGLNAVSVGLQSIAGSDNAVAIGSMAQTGAEQPFAVAIGSTVTTNGSKAIAIGSQAKANADNAVALGNNQVMALGESSLAIGNGAKAQVGATNGIAMGKSAVVAANTKDSMALGANASVTSAGAGGVALGASSVANRGNALSIGSSTTQRQIINVAKGTQGTDAVNLSQLKGVTDALGGGTAIGEDGSVKAPGYKIGDKTYNNVGDALAAVAENGGTDPNAVAYDAAAKDKVTLAGGTAGTTITNVKAGTLSATSMDAVNGSQLFATNEGLGNLKDSLKDGGVIDPTTGESLAVVYDAAAKDKVTLAGGKAGTTITNVKAGTLSATSTDAVNGSQLFATNEGLGNLKDSLKDGGVIDPTTGKSLAVVYDAAAKDKVTLAGGKAGTSIANVKAGVAGMDAVNVDQLTDGLSTLEDKLTNGAIDLKYIKVKSSGIAALATGSQSVAIGAQSMASGAHAMALGSGSRAVGNNSVAIGFNSVADDANTVSVGGAGDERRIVHVAAGEVAESSTDAVNGAQLYEAMGKLSSQVHAQGTRMAPSLRDAISPPGSFVAIDGFGSDGSLPSQAHAGEDPENNTAAAIGVSAIAAGGNAVSVGLQTMAGSDKSVAIGSFAQTGAEQESSVAIGSYVTTNGVQAVAIGESTQANADNALAIGSNKAMAVGKSSIAIGDSAKTLAGTENSIAMGKNAKVEKNITNAIALGANANASQASSIALGAGSVANRANALSIGSVGAERQIINVAKGTQGTDAVNVSQLKGVTDVIGGGAGVGADGSIVKPTYTIDGQQYITIGDALEAAAAAGGAGTDSNAVAYDDASKGSVSLAGKTGTVIHNVAAGSLAAGSSDAINGGQLNTVAQSVAESLGGGAAFDPETGKLKAPSYEVADAQGSGTVTYHNVGDAITNIDNRVSENTTQIDSLQQGLANAVQYDDASHAAVTLGGKGASTAVRLKNVADGADDTDAVNVRQLKSAGLVGEDGKLQAAVVYDKHADGTTNLGSVTLGGMGTTAPVALHNVAKGTQGTDAVNVSQLSGVTEALGGGAKVDQQTGEIVAPKYEVGGNTYHNAGDAFTDIDGRVTQIQNNLGNSTNLAGAVAYDKYADGTTNFGSVTLGNGLSSGPVVLTNVADGKNQYDAVNYGQLSALQGRVDNIDDRVTNALLPPSTGGGGSDLIVGTGGSATTSGDVVAANSGTGNGNLAAGSSSSVSGGANNGTAIGANAGVKADGGTAVGEGAKVGSGASNSVAIGQGSVATEANTVSMGSDGQERRIVNVADGVKASDAVSKGQFDRAMGGMQGQINDVSRNAYSGIAAATALTSIPGVDPGKNLSFGIGAGFYKGYQAVALGGEARITENLKMKAGVGLSSGGNTVGVGASYQW